MPLVSADEDPLGTEDLRDSQAASCRGAGGIREVSEETGRDVQGRISALTRVLVTGASTGIGRAVACRLAAAGASTWAGVRDAASVEELERLGAPELRPLIIDVTDQKSIDSARDLIHDRGGLDVLVNNAGIGIAGPLELLTSDELREQLDGELHRPARSDAIDAAVVARLAAPADRLRQLGRGSGGVSVRGRLQRLQARPGSGGRLAAQRACRRGVHGQPGRARFDLDPDLVKGRASHGRAQGRATPRGDMPVAWTPSPGCCETRTARAETRTRLRRQSSTPP